MTGEFSPRDPKSCQNCGEDLPLVRHYKKYLCQPCKNSLYPGPLKYSYPAHRIVAMAVRFGYLLPAHQCKCADCGEPASQYDHRDYNKPLDVDPVCARCNVKRGPAILFERKAVLA